MHIIPEKVLETFEAYCDDLKERNFWFLASIVHYEPDHWATKINLPSGSHTDIIYYEGKRAALYLIDKELGMSRLAMYGVYPRLLQWFEAINKEGWAFCISILDAGQDLWVSSRGGIRRGSVNPEHCFSDLDRELAIAWSNQRHNAKVVWQDSPVITP